MGVLKRKLGHEGDRDQDQDQVVKKPRNIQGGMVAGSFYIPKPKEGRPLGDDAHFVSHQTQSIGITDGIGGTAKLGVDPRQYARKLMWNSEISLLPRKFVTRVIVYPEYALKDAYAKTRVKDISTACIITYDESNGMLSYANVGDSGFMVFRNRKRVYVSPKQQHRFDCPFQLKGGDQPNSNKLVESACVGVVEVEKGDVVVAGTDGLFDNMHANEIEDILGQVVPGDTPEDLAWLIGLVAWANSINVDFDSPFAMEARNAGVMLSGGKADDIMSLILLDTALIIHLWTPSLVKL